ncbi:MAG TPA: hypothetical protein VFT32_07980 [Candidatus Eisenbacteria bacterium]|jgi:hypothetical protein|nr:hypothetical protein [Candidatus Eisenbacteria bacterium]
MEFVGVGTWLAAFLTLAALSFLYKDNPFFRFAESLFAGVSLGYYVGIVLNQTLEPNLFTPMREDFLNNWDLLVPGLMGLMLYVRSVPRIGWISRYSLAIYVAYYIGVEFTRKIHGEVLPQIARTMQPLAAFDGPTLVSLVFIVGVYSVLIYFFFSKEQNAVTRPLARLGVWFLMISFGAAFGFTVMGRIALLIGRLNFLILDWIYPTIGL